MTGQVDPERRLRCLTLGTYALGVVEQLSQPPGSRAKNLGKLIDDTLAAVEGISGCGYAETSASGLRPYRYDDQIDILSAVNGTRAVPHEILLRLKADSDTEDQADLQAAIHFFHDLARESLRQSHLSPEQGACELQR